MPSFDHDNLGIHAPDTSPPTSQDFRIGTLDLGIETSNEPQMSHMLGYPHVSDNSAVLYQVNQLIDLNMSTQPISNNQGTPINQVNGLRHFYGSGQVNMARSFDQIGSFNMAAPNQANPLCNVPRSAPQSFPTGVLGTMNRGATILNGSHHQAPHALANHTGSQITGAAVLNNSQPQVFYSLANHTGSWITGAAVLNNPQPQVLPKLANHTGTWLPGAAVLNADHPQPQVLHTSSNLSYADYNPQNNLWVPPKCVLRSKVRSQVATANMHHQPTTSILRPILSTHFFPPILNWTGVTLREFRLFNKFPLEIRNMIWSFTMTPRVVEVRISRRDTKDRSRQMYNFESFTPKPKVFSICQETRHEAMKYYKPMFVHEVNEVTRYIWVGPDDTVYFSFFRSGIGSNQSAATMLSTVFKKAGDYDRVAIPQGIVGQSKIYENSTVQFLTDVAVPLPFKNPHFRLFAELLVRCPKLKIVRLWNNVLPCTPLLDVLLRKRGQGKMVKIDDVAPITNPAKARSVGNFNEEQARDHFIGWLKRNIDEGDHPTGLKETPLVELGRIKAVNDQQWREFLE